MLEDYNAMITAITTMNDKEDTLNFIKSRLLNEELKVMSKMLNDKSNNGQVMFKVFPFAYLVNVVE